MCNEKVNHSDLSAVGDHLCKYSTVGVATDVSLRIFWEKRAIEKLCGLSKIKKIALAPRYMQRVSN